jgi:hypothetical protein
MKIIKVGMLVGSLLLTCELTSHAVEDRVIDATKAPTFFVYQDAGSKFNHFIPSGYMGDYGDIRINQAHKDGCVSGTCMEVKYSCERKQGAGWAGVYWQTPANNWGNKPGGFNLGKRSKLVFKAKGAKGKEWIDKFMIGGITSAEYNGDSDERYIDRIELTTEWKEYEIDLKSADLSKIIGGFGWAAAADYNDGGIVFYLDDIKLVQ